MWLHFILFFLLLLISYIFPPKAGGKNKVFLFLTFMLLFVIAAFRSYTVGNDTPEYYRVFKLISSTNSIQNALTVSRYDVGYIVLNYIVSHLHGDFTMLLCIITGFYLISVLRVLNKYSSNIRIAVLAFFAFSAFYDIMNVLRQSIAIAIFLFSLDFLIERKPLKYFAIVICATFFHSTSIILLLVYFVPRANFSKLKDVFKWVAIGGIGIIGLNYMIAIFTSFFPYYAHYFNSIYSVGGVRIASIGFLLVRLSIVVLLFMTGGIHLFAKIADTKSNVLLQLMMIDVLCSLASIGFNLFDRIEGFFTLGFILLMTNACETMTITNNKIIIRVLSVGIPLAYLTVTLIWRSNWYGLFPYSFVWN